VKDLLFVEKPTLLVAKIQDKDFPLFVFSIGVQELFCNVNMKDKKVVEGDPGYIRSSQFVVGIQRHPNPDLATMGHYWKIREIAQTGVFKQIV
jgi:hypothetical protein